MRNALRYGSVVPGGVHLRRNPAPVQGEPCSPTSRDAVQAGSERAWQAAPGCQRCAGADLTADRHPASDAPALRGHAPALCCGRQRPRRKRGTSSVAGTAPCATALATSGALAR